LENLVTESNRDWVLSDLLEEHFGDGLLEHLVTESNNRDWASVRVV
jgi:hypothetical protein